MFRPLLNDKIGNLLLYILEKLGPTYMTKMLKLVYLMDEKSINETGVPITWFSYKIWKMGPVATELYDEIRSGKPAIQLLASEEGFYVERFNFSKHINVVYEDESSTPLRIFISQKDGKTFDDSEFCDYEIDVMNEVLGRYKNASGKELSDITHKKGGPWSKGVAQYNLAGQFSRGNGTTDHQINFLDKDSDPSLLDQYFDAYNSLKFKESLIEYGRTNRSG